MSVPERELTAADYKSVTDLKIFRVPLPSLGAVGYGRQFGADTRDEFDLEIAEKRDEEKAAGRNPTKVCARLMRNMALRLGVVTVKGDPVFATDEEAESFAKRNGAAARTLYERILTENGLGSKAAKAIEGKSAAAPSGDSPSDSR